MRDSTSTLSSEINVTPFLDVLLVMIVIFLATSTTRRAMDAHLPEPCAGVCQSNGTPIVLEVLGDGRYLLNSKPLDAGNLLGTLQGVYSGRPEKIIQVSGRQGARYQEVLTAMDVARSAGVKVIGMM
jgi:biopolymer transport protein ExbD